MSTRTRTNSSPPISRIHPAVTGAIPAALARYRSRIIAEIRYNLALRLTCDATILRGEQTIRFRLLRPCDTLTLDWRPRLSPTQIASTRKSTRINGERLACVRFGHGALSIPGQLLKVGENRITLRWRAPIYGSGTAITRFQDACDQTRYAYSLFVPSDASTVFPCFDQPDLKARFTLSITIPRSWRAISNAPIDRRRVLGRTRRIEFAPTEPIPTYTFAFAAGPFVRLSATQNTETTALWVRPSQRRRAQAELTEVLRLNRIALDFCTKYFAHAFPFAKYDLLLIPDFPYRGMEHAGATFLDEGSVLIGASPGEQASFARAQLIFHETAHQWMGNLVTMASFADLWIKEGFANFVAYKLAERAVSRRYSQLAWHDLLSSAYEKDATRYAAALHNPVSDLSIAKAAYNTIVYAKAPVLLRTLEAMLGAATWRRAVRRLVERHAYRNTGWKPLIRAAEHASGRDLGPWAREWIVSTAHRRKTRPNTRAAGDLYGHALIGEQFSGNAVINPARPRSPLRRAQCWEQLWQRVEHTLSDPREFLAAVHDCLGRERQPLIVARVLGRTATAIIRYLPDSTHNALAKRITHDALVMIESSLEPTLRRAWLDALLTWVHDHDALDRLNGLPAARCEELGMGARLAIAAACAALPGTTIHRQVDELVACYGAHHRLMFTHCLDAARPDAARKRAVFMRWLDEPRLPESWITMALPYFNRPAHHALTLPLLPAALAAVPNLVRTHTIFFIDRWIAAFVSGQDGREALAIITRTLKQIDLPPLLRAKVLQAAEPLRRAQTIRRRWR